MISYIILHWSSILNEIRLNEKRNILFSSMTIYFFITGFLLLTFIQIVNILIDTKNIRLMKLVDITVHFSFLFSFLCSFVAVYKIYGALTLLMIPVMSFGVLLSVNLIPFNGLMNGVIFTIFWLYIGYTELI